MRTIQVGEYRVPAPPDNNYTSIVVLYSTGVDSTASLFITLQLIRNNILSAQYLYILSNKTPLSHPKFEEAVYMAAKRAEECIDIPVEVIITNSNYEARRPPACRWGWKENPTRKALTRIPRPCILVMSQRREESTRRAKLSPYGEKYGCQVYRPVYFFTKEGVKKIAYRFLPELIPIWEEIAKRNGGHTSLDCPICLRRLIRGR